ncbi:MAG: PH domain-containing protein [Deltaproteobacteria bacterium]|nr:PH domain-containing protein [Deltaproteobacteria bacterium]
MPDVELLPGEEIILRIRPAWRSFWVFMFGAAICLIGPWLRENPPLSPASGVLFGVVFLLIIFRRWSEVYTVTNQRLMVRGGLIARETSDIRLADIAGVETHKAGHILIRSRVAHQGHIIMYGQVDPDGLKARLDLLTAQVQGIPGDAPAP